MRSRELSEVPRKPTPAQLRAANGKSVPDLIAPNLKVLFCGINPGLYSAAVRHHFARPGNRFWPTLHRSGFTPRQFSPAEERKLLDLGYGITNVVERGTAAADELTADELKNGATALRKKIRRYRPKFFAMLGIGAYRTGFNQPKATIGLQDETIGNTKVFVLPNPSGLNANYQAKALTDVFRELKRMAG
jgi:TDG/mug DNA glycosylase family protein